MLRGHVERPGRRKGNGAESKAMSRDGIMPASKAEHRALKRGERSLRRWNRFSATHICLCVPVAGVVFLLWLSNTWTAEPVLYVKHGDRFIPLDALPLAFLRNCLVASIGLLLLVQSVLVLTSLHERRTNYTMIRRLQSDADTT
jgi:hypothetical protein